MARRYFGRMDEHKISKREKARVEKEQELKRKENFKQTLTNFACEKKHTSLLIHRGGLPSFFKDELEFKTGIVHVFRGNNGQGKTTLLKSIVKVTSLNYLEDNGSRLRITSNNKEIARHFNEHVQGSQYKVGEDSLFYKKLTNEYTNMKANITLYTDFSSSYFNNKEETFSTVIESVNSMSNGERKLRGINSIFGFLKILKELNTSNFDKALNILVCMDEPESGLSVELQEEFEKRVRYYLRKLNNEKISLTFFVVSHSFIWKNTSYCQTYNINDLKKGNENLKKEHKKVFV